MKLYVYDHCPYCVKARMIFGLKDIPFTLETLLNDDVQTPTSMIGQKMVPILQKDDGSYMPESMDIVHYIDEGFGDGKVLTGKSNPEVVAWTNSRDYLYKLAMPRWVKAPLEEFKTEGARQFFIEKKEAMIGPFSENLNDTPELKERAEAHLQRLDGLIQSDEAINGTLSEDDIHVFAMLRSLSIVKDMAYPAKVDAYRKRMAEKSGVPLHDDIAI